MSSTTRFLVSGIAAALSAGSIGLVPLSASAQMALEEVVVTARKREESLQDIPIAVTALSGENLQELGLRDLSDLRKVAPNVDIYDGNGTTGAGNAFIRGVGARNTGVNFDSGVGIYVDGVYVSRPDGAILDNVDLQSVQVLRGPQGTLFGKNTTGGAILYTTNKPQEEFEGHAEVRLGNYNQLDGQATVNVPITDDLFSRFSIYATTRDGYVESVSNGNPGFLDGEEYNDVDRRGGQAQLRWAASDDLTLDLNYNYAKTDQSARGQNCEVVDTIPGAGWQAELQNQFIIVPATGKTIQEWCQDNDDLGIDKIMGNLMPRYEAETQGLSFTADWDINDNVNFKSITAWRSSDGGETNELDAIGIPLLDRTNFGYDVAALRETDAYSQEFQFAGTAFDDKLEYVVGVFGFTEKSDAGTAVSPTGPFFGAVFNPLQAFYTNSSTELLTENSSASAFSQVDWNFNEQWRLTLGVRYTWEERELERKFRIAELATLATTGDAQASPLGAQFAIFPSGIDTFNPNHGFIVADDPDNPGQPDPLADQKLKIDNDDITPMASLQYSFEELGFINGGTVYATISNGFLSGGVTDTTSVVTREIEEFDPEEVWNYEVGVKMDAWDRRLRANIAMFYMDYTDRQLTTVSINPDTGRIAGALINAKSSSIAGIEIETQIIPVDNLQITANITFNEGDIDEYDDERILSIPDSGVPAECDSIPVGTGSVMNCPIDRSDENLPRLPKQIYYLAAQYNWETEMGRIVPMVAVSYRTDVDNCFDRSSCLSGVYLVDQEDVTARLTWFSNDENLRVSAYGNNLTDERYVTGGTPLVDVTQTAGTIYNLPRTYGVEIAYDF
jgi:iron complex outermembrane receptor protein